MLKKFNTWLKTWKPIHLCWWFYKHNKPIPKYFIGGGGDPPSVRTDAATDITKTFATLNGEVTSDGGRGVDTAGFVIAETSVNSNPTLGGTGVTDISHSTPDVETFSQLATAEINTQYSFCAYASNGKGTSYGSVLTFTTYDNISITLDSPSDTAEVEDTTPDLKFTGDDPMNGSITYQIQVDTVNTFDGQTVDSYSETNQNAYIMVTNYINEASMVGQSFTGDAGDICIAIFYLKRVGTPTGNAVAHIYEHTGIYGTSSKPTGLPVATSSGVDISNISDSGYELVTFTFPTPYTTTNGTKYVVVFSSKYGDSGTNVMYAGLDDSSLTHSGNLCYYLHSTLDWYSVLDEDLIFYVGGPLIDAESDTDSGFSGSPDNTDPFADEQQVTYTIQSADELTDSTTYYWRVRGEDGFAITSDWSSIWSFTITSGTPTNVVLNIISSA